MRVEVTQEHIDRGETLDPYSCPIALALKDLMGRENGYPYVSRDSLNWAYNDGTRISWTCEEAHQFVRDFDWDMHVEPTTFNFEEKESGQ